MPAELTLFDKWQQFLDRVLWKVDLVVDEIGSLVAYSCVVGSTTHEPVEASIVSRAQGDDLLLLGGIVVDEAFHKFVNGFGPDICTLGMISIWSISHRLISLPLLMMGNLL